MLDDIEYAGGRKRVRLKARRFDSAADDIIGAALLRKAGPCRVRLDQHDMFGQLVFDGRADQPCATANIDEHRTWIERSNGRDETALAVCKPEGVGFEIGVTLIAVTRKRYRSGMIEHPDAVVLM